MQNGLFRLPMQNETGITNFIYLFNAIKGIPLDAYDIAKETR